MSGHSKFANIKHKKQKNDSIRAKIFTRLGKEIAVAVKMGGKDPLSNSRLRDIISKARSNNMPNDNIERVIKKAAGDIDNVNYELIVYEGYGPNGVAVIVEALTDNRNRAAANVRSAFTKGGGNMGTTGCVSFLFEEKGVIIVLKEDSIDEDELMMMSIDSGATEFEVFDEYYEITTEPYDLGKVREVLEENNIPIENQEVGKYPLTMAKLESDEDKKKFDKLINLLEEDDDVQNVYYNCEVE